MLDAIVEFVVCRGCGVGRAGVQAVGRLIELQAVSVAAAFPTAGRNRAMTKH